MLPRIALCACGLRRGACGWRPPMGRAARRRRAEKGGTRGPNSAGHALARAHLRTGDARGAHTEEDVEGVEVQELFESGVSPVHDWLVLLETQMPRGQAEPVEAAAMLRCFVSLTPQSTSQGAPCNSMRRAARRTSNGDGRQTLTY